MTIEYYDLAADNESTTRPEYRVRSHGITDIGRNRQSNQDQFLIAEIRRAMQVKQSSFPQPNTLFSDQRGHLFVVADGMGGHAAGEQASLLAMLTIEQFMLNTLKWFFSLRGESLVAEFQDALKNADSRVFETVERHPELKGMGTTVTMAYAVNGSLYVVHAGDSRCYLFRRGNLYQLTNDHTLTQEMVREGLLRPQEVAHNPFRNVVINAVGGTQPGVRAEINRIHLEPNDVVLLCSDGLTKMLPDSTISSIVSVATEPSVACHQLVDMANRAGGRDNITAIVAFFETPGAERLPLPSRGQRKTNSPDTEEYEELRQKNS